MLAQRMSTINSGWQTSSRRFLKILSLTRNGLRLSDLDSATSRNSKSLKMLLHQLLLSQMKLSSSYSKTYTRLRLRMTKRKMHSTIASVETLTSLMLPQLPLTLKSQKLLSLAVKTPEMPTSLSLMPLLALMIALHTSPGSLTSSKNAATTLTATTMESRLSLISDAHLLSQERKLLNMLSGSSRVSMEMKMLELRMKPSKSSSYATYRSTETPTLSLSQLCPLEPSSMFQSCAQKRPRLLLRCSLT